MNHEPRGASRRQLLEDQQVPLLVVLLPAADPHPVEHPAGEPRLAGGVGDRDVGDVLPRLVRAPGRRARAPGTSPACGLAVDDVHDQEQGLRAEDRPRGGARRGSPAARRRGGRGRVAPSARTAADQRRVGRSARWPWGVPDPRRPFYPTVDRGAAPPTVVVASQQVSVYVARCASWCSAARTFAADVHRTDHRAASSFGLTAHPAATYTPPMGRPVGTEPAHHRSIPRVVLAVVVVAVVGSWLVGHASDEGGELRTAPVDEPSAVRSTTSTQRAGAALCATWYTPPSCVRRRGVPTGRRAGSCRARLDGTADDHAADRPSSGATGAAAPSTAHWHWSAVGSLDPVHPGRLRGHRRRVRRRHLGGRARRLLPGAHRPGPRASTTSTSTRSAATATCGCSRTPSSTTPARPTRLDQAAFAHNTAMVQTGPVLHAAPSRDADGTDVVRAGHRRAAPEPLVLAARRRARRRSPAGVLGRDGQDRRPRAARRARLGAGAYLVGDLRRRHAGPVVFQPAPDVRRRRRSTASPWRATTSTRYLFGNSFDQNLARQGGFYACPCSATRCTWRGCRGARSTRAGVPYGGRLVPDPAAAVPIVNRYYAENPMQPRFLDGRWVAGTKVDGYWGDELADRRRPDAVGSVDDHDPSRWRRAAAIR